MNSGSWNPDEIERFEWALNQYGKDYTMISEHVKTRSRNAIAGRFHDHVKDKSLHYYGKFWTTDEKQKFVDAVK